MKRILSIATTVFFIGSTIINAQELPVPSPAAKVTQTVGVTTMSVEYSSPAKRGRTIFGDLVPYDKLWRTGANKATIFTTDQDITIKGDTLKKGSYSLFTIPGQSEWTVVFNNETELWGIGGYKEDNDALRIKVKPTKGVDRERLTFLFSEFTYDNGNLDIEWAGVKVSVPFTVFTDDLAMANIEEAIMPSAREYANAANYTLRTGKHMDKGLEWIEMAIEKENHWYYSWIKASLLKESGKMDEAIKTVKIAKELGDKSDRFYYKDKVEKAIKEWK